MKLRSILILALVLLCAFVAGCDEEDAKEKAAGVNILSSSSGSSVDSSSAAGQEASTMNVKVYYPDANAMGLVGVVKTVKATNDGKYKAAIEALLAGTNDKNLTTVFPKDVKLLKVAVSGNTAKVDFDGSLTSGFVGGSTGEEMLVGSVVNTLTEFSEIKKVQILVDGQEIETLSGHLDLTKPLGRMDELISK